LFRGIFFASLLGTLWVLLTIWFYDPSGTLEVIYYLKGKPAAKNKVKADGLFLLIRHPIYILMILMMWSYPEITTDRLLFNVLWTTWMLTASFLEERDLIADHGKSYLNYRKRVPMFIPNGSSISAIKERFRKGTGLSF
jgi:protein-S-isoprenylcysteine O-methyltransferase Ste14